MHAPFGEIAANVAAGDLILARSFRYYQKKRGHRRTGSPALASAGEAAFWAVLLLLGCGGAVWLFVGVVVPEWRVHHEFIETTCRVLDKRIARRETEDGTLYRPEIWIEYEVGEITYRDWHYDIHRAYSGDLAEAEAAAAEFAVDDASNPRRYPCWYDPINPSVAVLVRGHRWWVWMAFTVPLSFVALGAGGLLYALLHWGKSAERRAAQWRRPQERDLFAAGNGDRLFPFVPEGADITNSPGTRLRFRLPMATSPGWVLFGTLVFCLIWDSLVAVAAVFAVSNHVAGRGDWLTMIFLVPLVLIGVGMSAFFLRQLLVATSVGPTLVELSEHPLRPGGRYRLFLSQTGRLRIRTLCVALLCRESAAYRQGTNTRTETQTVYRKELFRREDFEIETGAPFETELQFDVPPRSMHSFKADYNEIEWSLAVEGDLIRRPRFQRSFTVVVQPSDEGVKP